MSLGMQPAATPSACCQSRGSPSSLVRVKICSLLTPSPARVKASTWML